MVVSAQYPRANPKVIAETVATPLEESINGVEGMLYMGSQATTDGVMTLTVTFALGTDPDKAQQLVQNRVSQAEPRLPEEVRRLGVTTVKSAPDLTMVVHLVSPNNRYDIDYLRNYAVLNVKDRLARIQGVGQVQIFGGGDYSMRVWLDPQKVAQRGLSASDVVAAIRGQNVQAAAGVVGASPGLPGVDLQLSINAQGRLQTEEEFGDIIVKTGADGEPSSQVVRLRDIARLELGAADYSLRSLLNNDPAVGMGVFQAPGSNALAVLAGEVASGFVLPPATGDAALPVIPPGVPGTVLARRPDVSAAQAAVLAAQARVGVAQKAWFPAVTLTGNAGHASPELGELFKWSARAWGLSGLLSLPIFDGGHATPRSRAPRRAWRLRWRTTGGRCSMRSVTWRIS